MQTLLAVLAGALGGLRALVGLVLPIFADAADFRSWPVWLRVLLGFALIAGLCVGLYFLQYYTGLNDYLTFAPNAVRPYFLVVLFVLLIVFGWLAFGLWKLLTAEPDEAEFPDLRGEWAEAVRKMAASGLGVGDAPLFLVLGRPAAGLDSLFRAAGVKGIIRAPTAGADGSGDPSIRVYAWGEAIFVVCPGASAWGHFCSELANPTADAGLPGAEDPNAAGKTLAPGAAFGGIDPALRAEMEALISESSRRELHPDEQARLRELVDELQSAPAVQLKRVVTMSDADRARLGRRFRYLCKLIRKDRAPWCPLNGVLAVVPWATLDTNELVALGSSLLEGELNAARDVFQQRYPTFALVTDLETARGYDEFRRGFRPELLKQRLGQRFPLVPVVAKREEVAGHLANVARWLGTSVLPRWILEFLKLDTPTDVRRTPAPNRMHNRNLYLLMRTVFDRGPRLADVLSRGLPPVGGGDDLADVPMFGGCYLAATGRGADEQAFVQMVFERVIEGQNAVSWAPAALAADARLKRTAALGYLALGVLVLAAAAAAYWLLQVKK